MQLRFNPLQVFKASTTPAGLYARRNWLGESNTRTWKNDFHNTLLILMKDQKRDGSWNGSEIETITRLFVKGDVGSKTTCQLMRLLDKLSPCQDNHEFIHPEHRIIKYKGVRSGIVNELVEFFASKCLSQNLVSIIYIFTDA